MKFYAIKLDCRKNLNYLRTASKNLLKSFETRIPGDMLYCVYCILFYNQYRQSIRCECEVVRLTEIRAFNTKKDYYTAV